MEKILRRSWAEVDLDVIRKNLRLYKAVIPKDKEIMGVIKADAYGHGDVQVGRVLQSEGVNAFAVSNIEEACTLRQAGIKGLILILGYTPADEAKRLKDNDIVQAVVSEEHAEALAATGIKVKCQFKLDTGMNRLGLNADEPEYCAEVIRKYADKLDIDGLFTHLCVADDDSEESKKFTRSQVDKFEAVAALVKDMNLAHVHCLNSAGGIFSFSEVSCFVRLGIILYGLKPDYKNVIPEGIEPALTWKSVVSMVKDLYPGETVGYGRTFKAESKIRVATVPTGYADGYNRLLSNKGYVLINGKKAKIIGRVCMDQFMVDVTDIPDVGMDTEVTLLGKNGSLEFNADDMAQLLGTIGYEVVCDIGRRVPRVYKNA